MLLDLALAGSAVESVEANRSSDSRTQGTRMLAQAPRFTLLPPLHLISRRFIEVNLGLARERHMHL